MHVQMKKAILIGLIAIALILSGCVESNVNTCIIPSTSEEIDSKVLLALTKDLGELKPIFSGERLVSDRQGVGYVQLYYFPPKSYLQGVENPDVVVRYSLWPGSMTKEEYEKSLDEILTAEPFREQYAPGKFRETKAVEVIRDYKAFDGVKLYITSEDEKVVEIDWGNFESGAIFRVETFNLSDEEAENIGKVLINEFCK